MLAAEGFVERQLNDGVRTAPRTRPLQDDELWTTTVRGGALTMASFLRPISRAKADVLLAGVIDRARAYNGDDAKPRLISEICVFGSFLQPEITELGDLDLGVTLVGRGPWQRPGT